MSRWLTGPGLFPDAPRWGGRLWILHAMYENFGLPATVTYDDLARLEFAGGGGADVVPGSQLLGAALGRTSRPGPEWRRLRWAELGVRLGIDPLAAGEPSFRSFPWPSWPISIAPPGEGSLDREQFLCLVAHVAASESATGDTPCCAFYDLLIPDDGVHDAYFAGPLAELTDLYDDEALPGSPTRVWPADRSWFFHTDPDRWGTTVCGPADLIRRLTGDPELEAVPA